MIFQARGYRRPSGYGARQRPNNPYKFSDHKSCAICRRGASAHRFSGGKGGDAIRKDAALIDKGWSQLEMQILLGGCRASASDCTVADRECWSRELASKSGPSSLAPVRKARMVFAFATKQYCLRSGSLLISRYLSYSRNSRSWPVWPKA